LVFLGAVTVREGVLTLLDGLLERTAGDDGRVRMTEERPRPDEFVVGADVRGAERERDS
jgi:hypothetical protein